MQNYREKIKFLLKHNPGALQTEYHNLCKILQREKPECLERTKEERKLEGMINKATKLQYFTNFWIGKYNFDFFFPSICSRGDSQDFKGLVIEINGNIHHTQFKMKKDFIRVEYLHSLGIASTVIENWDLKTPTVMNLTYNLQNLPRLDHRGKKRLLNKVYYETLIAYKDLIKGADSLNNLYPLQLD